MNRNGNWLKKRPFGPMTGKLNKVFDGWVIYSNNLQKCLELAGMDPPRGVRRYKDDIGVLMDDLPDLNLGLNPGPENEDFAVLKTWCGYWAAIGTPFVVIRRNEKKVRVYKPRRAGQKTYEFRTKKAKRWQSAGA